MGFRLSGITARPDRETVVELVQFGARYSEATSAAFARFTGQMDQSPERLLALPQPAGPDSDGGAATHTSVASADPRQAAGAMRLEDERPSLVEEEGDPSGADLK
ncbi:MAG: hypothetical protein LBI20_00210 [Holosporales bacterium]|jgi:hypothetical protein|nr:hypothetical protein [Holosporales bacterium]